MASFAPVAAIEVRLWGTTVGAVAMDALQSCYVFEYAASFLKSGIEPAPLMMPLRQGSQVFLFPNLPELTFKRLPAMLADALPDDFGNALIDAWMARQGVNKNAITALDRLAYMGRRGMGALEFRPTRGPRVASHAAIKMNKLVEDARRVLHGDLDSDASARAALSQIFQVGTSAGGARAKAAIAWNPSTGEIRPGQFDVDPGFEHWLLKFDGMGADKELGPSQQYGRIEYAYYLMARAAKIDMSPCRLLEENGRAHFMTKRFDRDGKKKHHMQSLCAMQHLDYKQRGTHDYSQLLMAIDALNLPYAQREDAFRRMVFNVVAANCDDHTKNFSFRLRQGEGWELAPAYDVTHAYNPKGEWTYQHLMSVNARFSGITRADCMAVAERFRIGTAPAVIDQVNHAMASWPAFAKKAGVTPAETAAVGSDHVLI